MDHQSGRRSGDYLFPSRIGKNKPLTTRHYARLMDGWVTSIGSDPVLYGTHSLRQTKVALIYRRTGSLRAVQLLLRQPYPVGNHAHATATTNNDGQGRSRWALVTGASSGIGRAFALRLGADGYNLVVVGRRRDRLDEVVVMLPEVSVRPLVANLATEAGVDAVADACASETLDLLVNNAGVAFWRTITKLI